MSVKVHEAFCMDSFQDRLLFFDDFHGDQIQDEWATAGTGSVAVVDAQTGGIIRLTTGAVINNARYVYWGNIRSLHVDQKATAEYRVKLTQTANVSVRLFIRFDFNNGMLFYYNSGVGATWHILNRDGAAETNQDSGINADTDYHIFRIEALPTGEVHFYIDGVECANSPLTTNIPDDAGDYLEPFLYIETLENLAKSMDVDYVYLRQER